jgi:hypothetical protein
MIDFKGLETFVWVATLGSFAAPPRSSTPRNRRSHWRIAQLEGDLGIRLLHRGQPGGHADAARTCAARLCGEAARPARRNALDRWRRVDGARVLLSGVAETIVLHSSRDSSNGSTDLSTPRA